MPKIETVRRIEHRKDKRTVRQQAFLLVILVLLALWNEERRAFVQHYDSDSLDASNLLMPLFFFFRLTTREC